MKAGLLPLYLTLYEQTTLEYRKRLEPFYDEIAEMLEKEGIEIVKNLFCMENADFESAVAKFEAEKCDVIITLHMTYSPSLKCIDALAKTKLPIVVCDATDTFDFSDNGDPGDIMYCHGIHGVMDMCNMLKRNKKPYVVAAGHYKESDVIKKTVAYAKAAASANSVFGAKVGSVGGSFDGMGDFRIDDADLKKLYNVDVIYPKEGEFNEIAKTVTEAEIAAAKEYNKNLFNFVEDIDENMYVNSIKADIILRKWIENNNLDSLTVNFREIGDLPTMPFHGICMAMADGIGYAGEGDTLTALFTGALMKGYDKTSFIEIFCPDWKGNSALISHMGEMNYNLAQDKPECFEKAFIYGKGVNPIVGTAAFKAGKAVFVNVFEDENGMNLLAMPVDVLGETTDKFAKNIRGWIKFDMPLDDALARISNAGATHHSILVYDTTVEEMQFFAKCAGLNIV